jgi:hypothetical protein
MSDYGDKTFGLRDIKVTNIGGTVQADFPVAQTLTFRVRVRSGELSGDDSLVAVVSFVEAAEIQFGEGGVDLDAMAIMTGISTAVSGTSPSEKTTLNFDAGDAMPYFKLYGRSLGDNGDDLHVKFYKVKLNSAPEFSLQDGQFVVTNLSAIGVSDGTNGILDIVQNETATTLPTS